MFHNGGQRLPGGTPYAHWPQRSRPRRATAHHSQGESPLSHLHLSESPLVGCQPNSSSSLLFLLTFLVLLFFLVFVGAVGGQRHPEPPQLCQEEPVQQLQRSDRATLLQVQHQHTGKSVRGRLQQPIRWTIQSPVWQRHTAIQWSSCVVQQYVSVLWTAGTFFILPFKSNTILCVFQIGLNIIISFDSTFIRIDFIVVNNCQLFLHASKNAKSRPSDHPRVFFRETSPTLSTAAIVPSTVWPESPEPTPSLGSSMRPVTLWRSAPAAQSTGCVSTATGSCCTQYTQIHVVFITFNSRGRCCPQKPRHVSCTRSEMSELLLKKDWMIVSPLWTEKYQSVE